MTNVSTNIHTFTGVWINWSHGRVQGTTLTLTQQHGGFLSAFLAIFVTFAGGMFWKILSFTLHQSNASSPDEQNKDGLHQNRQAILRNSTGASDAAWSLLTLLPFRKGELQRPALRCLPFVLLAVLNVASFGIAGIFTSEITKAPGNSTLLIGNVCGGYEPVITAQNQGILSSKDLADTNVAATYVRQCYQNSTLAGACGGFMRPSLQFKSNANASCPFESGTCLISNQDALAMDTGLLDSHEVFGINSAPAGRVQFRRVATCAPLHGKLFGSYVNLNNNDSVIGPKLLIDAGPTAVNNVTFTYFTRTFLYGVGYSLSATYSMAADNLTIPQWIPVKQLFRADAEVTLMMLNQNTVAYLQPSDDPWMPAHRTYTESPGLYFGDFDANLLGCTDQYQICNPQALNKSKGCTALTSSNHVLQELLVRNKEIGLNNDQIATTGRFLGTSSRRIMFQSVFGRGQAALNAQETLNDILQAEVPNNQWQREVSIWFSTALAKEQAWAVEWATGIRNIDLSSPAVKGAFIFTPPATPQEAKQCQSQLVRDSGTHMNFSVLGVVLILTIGGLIIIAGLCVDTVIGWARNKYGRKTWKAQQWSAEETLALQQAAYEGLGLWGDGKSLPSSLVFVAKGDERKQTAETNEDGGKVYTAVSVQEAEDPDERA